MALESFPPTVAIRCSNANSAETKSNRSLGSFTSQLRTLVLECIESSLISCNGNVSRVVVMGVVMEGVDRGW
jgi:hypothetical protein